MAVDGIVSETSHKSIRQKASIESSTTASMLTYPLVLTTLLAAGSTAAAAASSRSTKQEFISAMRKHKTLDPKIMADVAKSTTSSLKKSIMDEAIMVPPGRKLEDAAAADQEGQGNANQKQQNANYYSNNYIQGTDDLYAFDVDVDWENLWGFDASQYVLTLSYERCATVKQFDVEKAAEEDATSPFRTQHFDVLRLCPAKTCDRPDWYLEANEGNTQDVQEDNGEVYGANGRGCSSNYATFLLDAGKYLQLMAEFEDSQFNMYCNYCERYMDKMYELWLDHHPSYGYTFEDMNSKKHDAEWYSCSVYGKVCNVGFEDNYADLLECAEVQKNNGMVAYTQATCAEDGETITLGLFSDKYCSEDITSTVNMANWLGEEVDEDKMSHYYKRIDSGLAELIETYGGTTSVDPESVCLPCGVQNQAWFVADDDVTRQAQQHQEEGAYQYSRSSQGEIADICDAVFMQSVRCDKTLNNWWRRKRNAKYAESNALQDLSCEFIDNMRMGKFDTEGNVVMDANRLYNEDGSQGNLFMEEYGQGIKQVSPLQILMLILSMSACVVLGAWSTSLHKSLSKGGWKPRRGVKSGGDDVGVSDQSSGVAMERNASYYLS